MSSEFIISGQQKRHHLNLQALAPWFISLALLVFIPFITDNNTIFIIFNAVAINIVYALSYNMLLGQGGMLSFGHAIFFGFGGFAAVYAMNAIGDATYAGTGFWAYFPVIALPLVGMAVGALTAFIIGWPICRHSGVAFAMITLGLGALVASGVRLFPSIFGGETGVFSDRVVGPEWFGLELVHAADVYWFMVFWVFVATFAMWFFTRTPLGRMSNAMRDNEQRLTFIGYPPRNIRFLVLIVSGAFGGLAGSMSVVNYEIITPLSFGLIPSGMALLMAAVGGLGVFYGPIIGAVVVTTITFMLSDYSQASVLYVGLIFLSVVLFAPHGLAAGVEVVRLAWRENQLARHLPAWSANIIAVLLSATGLVMLVELIYQMRHGQSNLFQMLNIHLNPSGPWGWVILLMLFSAAYGVVQLSSRKYREIQE